MANPLWLELLERLIAECLRELNDLLGIVGRRIEFLLHLGNVRVNICAGHVHQCVQMAQLLTQFHNASCAAQVDVRCLFQGLKEIQCGSRMENNVYVLDELFPICRRDAQMLEPHISLDGYDFRETRLQFQLLEAIEHGVLLQLLQTLLHSLALLGAHQQIQGAHVGYITQQFLDYGNAHKARGARNEYIASRIEICNG